MLKHYGVDNVEDLTLVEDSNSQGLNRGFAFLEFSSRSEAMDAFKRLQKRDVVFGVDRPAKVSFADSFIDPGDEIMAQVYTLMSLFLHLTVLPLTIADISYKLHLKMWPKCNLLCIDFCCLLTCHGFYNTVELRNLQSNKKVEVHYILYGLFV